MTGLDLLKSKITTLPELHQALISIPFGKTVHNIDYGHINHLTQDAVTLAKQYPDSADTFFEKLKEASFMKPILNTDEELLVIIRECIRFKYFRKNVSPDVIGYLIKKDIEISDAGLTYYRFLPSFAYISETNPPLFGYTQSWEKGFRDIQSVIKPGRYFRSVMGIASDDKIKKLTNSVQPYKPELKFVWDDPKEWVRVYQKGPQSCMGKKTPKDFGLEYEDIHPVEAYALKDNGIGLAYLQSNGLIGARTIVTDNEKYLRIYRSDYLPQAADDLKAMLNKEGYYLDHDCLHGRKLTRIESDSGDIICPFIDHDNVAVDVYDRFLEINPDGEYQVAHESATLIDSEHNRVVCDDCNARVREEDSHHLGHYDTTVCGGCLDSYHHAYTRHGEDRVHEDECIYCESNDEYYSSDYSTRKHHDIVECTVSGEYWFRDDCHYIEDSGEYAHTDYTTELYNGDYALSDDCTELYDGSFALKDDNNLILLDNDNYAIIGHHDLCRHIESDTYYLTSELEEVA